MADPINIVTWWEIPVADLHSGARFFGAVFGWTFAPMGDGYLGVHADGVLIGGLFESPETTRGEGVRVYVNVADLEANLAAAESAGGTIRRGRTEIGGDMGWWAEIADPAGRTLGLCTSEPARA